MKRLLAVLLLGLGYAATAHGFGKGLEGCSGDCTACHSVTRNEVVDILKGIDPALTVIDVAPAPVRSLYQITVKKEGQPYIFYLDFSKNFLVAGQVYDIRGKKDLTRQSMEEALRIDVSRISLESALVMGNRKGSKTLYLFSDPECPYCSKLHQELQQLVKEEPQLKVYIILNPLDIHPNALWKSQAIHCRARENMADALKMLENSYQNREVKRLTCDRKYAEENRALAKDLGIKVTPVLVFPDGRVLMGFKGKEDIRKMLNRPPAGK